MGRDAVVEVGDCEPRVVGKTLAAFLGGVADRLALYLPDEFAHEPADVFVANILAGPLAQLAPRFAQCAKPGAPFALSGILQGQQDELLAIYAQWFDDLAIATREDWVRISGRRHA